MLIDGGADINAKRQDGTNALYWAKSWRRLEIVEMLEKAGAREEVPIWAREGTGGLRN